MDIHNEYDLAQKELDIQMEYIKKIKKINEQFFNQTTENKICCVQTFGCQMNARDSEKISAMLTEMGYQHSKCEKDADFIIYNTCCIRENAEKKVFGKLGYLKKLKEKKPNLVIGFCGCMAQTQSVQQTIRKSYPHVNLLFGTHNFYKFPEYLYSYLTNKTNHYEIWDQHQLIVENLPSKREDFFKASVNIMYGCDNFCSYCVVPYVRGRERSREKNDIIQEIKLLVKDGVKEITLLGQNVNSYGKNLQKTTTFADLLLDIANIEQLKRIRFMTSHPKDLSDELIETISRHANICKHIHLPLQSGSNRILKAMNRKYSSEDYLLIVDKLRKKIPNISFSTDIIVSFPGETEEDFEHTLEIIRKVRFSSVFSFIYSPRANTPAAGFDHQIDEDITKIRFNKLLHLVREITKKELDQYIGKKEIVLVETFDEEKKYLTGRNEQNILVHFQGERTNIGELMEVEIKENKTFYLMGKLL